jgi:hypothetical protein
MKFGWFPENRQYSTIDLMIRPLPEFEQAITTITDSENIHDDWFYPPIQLLNNSNKTTPAIPTPWFALPATHSLDYTGPNGSAKLKEFLILILGWLKGLKLQPEGWGHFYKVAVKPRKLIDFFISEKDIPALLNLTVKFYHKHESNGAAATMFGAVHWYLFSQSYSQYFEKLMMQYTVFDTIYNINTTITKPKSKHTHADRLQYISDILSVPLPKWGVVHAGKSELSTLRNELIHEAKFCGEPIGFAVPSAKSNILLELEAFNCRLIAATLGAVGSYTRSSSETRQIHSFEID